MHPVPRRLLTWLASAIVTAVCLWTVAGGVLTIVIDGFDGFLDSLALAPAVFVGGLFWSLVASVAYGPALALWPVAVTRWPRIDATWTGLAFATGLLALPPMIVAPHAASTFPFASPDYFKEFVTLFLPVCLMSWGGLFLPRIFIPTLRPGAFAKAAA